MLKNRIFLKWTLLYFLLIAGYLYLYVIDVDKIIHPGQGEEVKSKIDFVYSQF